VGRLSGFSASQLCRVAEELGWREVRQRGSHIVFKKKGDPRNLVIPNHRTLREGTVRSLIDTMGVTVDEFLELVKK
jgi:predicted RNA binding protein YcfA (HicA-like mRNA interferase family)